MNFFKSAVFWFIVLATAILLRAGEKVVEDTHPELAEGVYAEFTTPRGTFVVELNHREAPMTVAHFVGLAEGTLPAGKASQDGKPFYTGLKWYRVVPGFVIQSGDPVRSAAAPGAELTEADDAAGHPLPFPDEFVPGLRHSAAGVLSMANAGPDTNSSEFFLTLGDSTRLNYLHSVFGHVVRGLDVLAQIQPDDPFSIKILRIGETGRAFKADAATFAALRAKAKPYTGAPEPGLTAHFHDPDAILPVEPPRARAFNFKLANYERVTGLKIMARLSAQAPPAGEDEVPGAYMKALATKLGVARAGVLVAYLGTDDWRVWIGDELVPAFLGRPVAPGDLDEGGALHDAKDTLITAALRKGDEAFADQQKTAPADRQPAPGQHIKLQTDALLDALMLHLELRR